MLDWISAILSATSVLQNIKLRKTREEKIAGLKEFLSHVDQVHTLLTRAKKVHDEFQVFNVVARPDLEDRLTAASQHMDKISEALSSFIRQKQLLIAQTQPAFVASSTQVPRDTLPVEIAESIRTLNTILPELSNALQDFEKHFEKMKALHAEENFGNTLRAELKLVNTHADSTHREWGQACILTSTGRPSPMCIESRLTEIRQRRSVPLCSPSSSQRRLSACERCISMTMNTRSCNSS
jgi:hypothetical protein